MKNDSSVKKNHTEATLGFDLGLKYRTHYNKETQEHHSYTRYGFLLFSIHVSKDAEVRNRALTISGVPRTVTTNPSGETIVKSPLIARF